MKILRLLICLGILCFTLSAAQAEGEKLSPKAVDLSNKFILSIYQDIQEQKVDYPELSAFGENNLFENKNGIYALIYEYVDAATSRPYRFGVTVNLTDTKDFIEEDGYFSYGFPKLDLKIAGFVQKHPIRKQFDIMPLIPKYGVILAEYQQEFMPLQIEIRPTKEIFWVNEDIVFDVILKNVSKRHMVVKALGRDSLFFLINNQEWGTNPTKTKPAGKNEVLKSGEEIRLRLVGESFSEPQELEVTCFYGMSIDGVNPMGKTKIVIEE